MHAIELRGVEPPRKWRALRAPIVSGPSRPSHSDIRVSQTRAPERPCLPWTDMQEHELIYDWNTRSPGFSWEHAAWSSTTRRCATDCSRRRSSIHRSRTRRQLLHLMAELGIAAANIGLPGAGPRTRADTLALAREIVSAKLPISANCAARTLATDIEPIARIAQEIGAGDRGGDVHRLVADPAVRRGLDAREDGAGERGRGEVRGGRGAFADVRHRGHDARQSRDAARAVRRRDRVRRAARLSRGHGGPRDARRRARARALRARGDRRAVRRER